MMFVVLRIVLRAKIYIKKGAKGEAVSSNYIPSDPAPNVTPAPQSHPPVDVWRISPTSLPPLNKTPVDSMKF